MKKAILFLTGISIIIAGIFIYISRHPSKSDDERIRETISSFYELSYESCLKNGLQDFSHVVEESSKWGNNYLNYMDNTVRRNKYAEQKGYLKEPLVKAPYEILFTSVQITNEEASADIEIRGSRANIYPFFLLLGKNSLTLNKSGGTWKIDSLQFPHDRLFDQLNDGNIRRIDDAELYRSVDDAHGVKKPQ